MGVPHLNLTSFTGRRRKKKKKKTPESLTFTMTVSSVSTGDIKWWKMSQAAAGLGGGRRGRASDILSLTLSHG